jgi:tetratricopeptide (TPR) repeat protein
MENKFDNVEKKFLEATAWSDKSDFAEARKILLDIITENSDFPNTYGYLGWIYSSKFSDDIQAEYYFKKGIEIGSHYLPTYYVYIGFLLERGRTDDAKKLLVELEKKPTASWYEIYVDYALIYEIEGKFGMAIKFYEKASQKSLNNEALNKTLESITRCRKKRAMKNPFYFTPTDNNKSSVIIIVLFYALAMLLIKFLI